MPLAGIYAGGDEQWSPPTATLLGAGIQSGYLSARIHAQEASGRQAPAMTDIPPPSLVCKPLIWLNNFISFELLP